MLRGLSRAVVGRTVPSDHPGLWVEADPVAEPAAVSGRAKEMVREYRAVVRGIAEKLGNPRIADALAGVDDPGALADTAGWAPDLSVERKVELLEELDPEARLEIALGFVRETLAELDLSEQIRSRVTEGMDKTQREFLLRQQLSAIREELGETGDADDAVAEYRQKLSELVLPDDVRVAIEREVDRFERTSEQSPEHGWIRTWLDTVLEIPWGTRSDERLDVVERARDPRRRPHRPRRREGPHRRVPGGAQAARRARHERQRPAHQGPARRGRDPGAGRSSRRRQDVARRVGRARARTRVRARRARAACTTRPSCVVTGARTSGRAPVASCGR